MSFRYQLLTLLGVLLISLSFGCGTSQSVSNGPMNMSLIISTINNSGPRLEHIMQYQFVNGDLVSTETVFTHPVVNPYFTDSQLHQNRYLISKYGDILDIRTGEVAYGADSGAKYLKLKAIDGDKVIVYSEDTGQYYSYNLEKRECSTLTTPTKWALPGCVSPDGTKSITVEHPVNLWGCNEILLHTLDGSNTSLGTNFCEQLSWASSHFPAVPVMWLDNQSFITQVSNGEIVVVRDDGTIEPVVKINLSQEIHPSTLQLGLLSALFSADSSGNIIYRLYYAYYPAQEPGANVKWFTIDTVNKSYSPCCTEWIDIGHGFEAAVIADNNNFSIRYNGEYIGEAWFTYYYAKTAEGHLAVVSYYARERAAAAEGVKVWSNANNKWTAIDYESPIWLLHGGLIGWIIAPRP